MKVREGIKKYGDICVALVALIALMVYEIFFSGKIGVSPVTSLADGIITRALGTIVAAVAVKKSGYKVFKKCGYKAVIAVLPCFAAVVCTPPLIGLIIGDASLSYTGGTLALYAFLFIAECLLVGAFEELLFRGILFRAVAARQNDDKAGRFLAVIISSAVFALVHLFNLFTSSPLAVLMQVGYSFLLGGACCFTFLKTENILYCVLLHAAFNFCGGLTDTLGYGGWGGAPSYALSAIVCTFVAVYVLVSLSRRPCEGKAEKVD